MTLSILQQNLRDPDFAQNPYPTYQEMHAAGGTVWWDEYSCVVFASFADVSAILRDRRFGRTPINQPTPPDHLKAFYSFEARSMLELEGAAHRALRKPVTRAFVNRRIDALRPAIEALAHGLIDKFVDEGEADLLSAYCEPIPVITIAQLPGLQPCVAPQLLSWSHDMVAMYQFGGNRKVEDRAEAATQAFTAFIAEQIEQRQMESRDDLLSHLMAPDENGARLAKDDIIVTSILILNAGHEATVHALGNGV